jgi:general secretion pathway protein N
MRFRLPLNRTLFFLAAFAFATIALIPLRVIVSRAGPLAAREASGGIWAGMLKEAQFGPVPLGDVEARLNLLPLFLGPLPIAALDLDDVSVHFSDGLCETAEGRVRVGLSGEMAGVALPAALAGDARCAEGALLLPLASPAGRIDLMIRADGRYRADLILRPTDPALAPRLAAAGFTASAEGYSRRIEGSF